jgi:hypothetical protein
MKRHTRPYGCTFPKCQKIFGSKNDWKRHETSQHYQLEIWRCDGEINGQTCTKAFFSAEIFRAHLEKSHDLSDQEIDSKIVAPCSRVFNSQAHFWCGFCERIVELHQADVDTWTERFNHIDDHFMGRHGTTKQSISEWLDPDRDDNSKTSAFGREPDHSQSRRKLVDFPAGSSSVTSFSMSDCTGQTISEVGIDWDGSKNSDTRVYYNMYNMIKGQQEEDVAKMQNRSGLGGYPTQEVVVGKLMRELPSIFNKEWAAKIEIQGENRPTAPTDSVRENRSTEYSDELGQENANSRAPKRLKTGSVRAADDDIRLRLACPFRKHDPRKYTIQSYRSCALSSWYSIARVKYDTHYVSVMESSEYDLESTYTDDIANPSNASDAGNLSKIKMSLTLISGRTTSARLSQVGQQTVSRQQTWYDSKVEKKLLQTSLKKKDGRGSIACYFQENQYRRLVSRKFLVAISSISNAYCIDIHSDHLSY